MKRWVPQEEEAIRLIRHDVNDLISKAPPFPEVVGDRRIVRFYRGFNHNVKEASKAYREFLQWRSVNNIDFIRQDILFGRKNNPYLFPCGPKILKLIPQVVISPYAVDKKDCPIAVETFSFHPKEVLSQITLDEYLLFLKYSLEYRSLVLEQISHYKELLYLQTHPRPQDRKVGWGVAQLHSSLRDLSGLGLSHLSTEGVSILNAVLRLGLPNYPNILDVAHHLNCPLSARLASQSLLDSSTQSRLNVLGTNFLLPLLSFLPSSSIPLYLLLKAGWKEREEEDEEEEEEEEEEEDNDGEEEDKKERKKKEDRVRGNDNKNEQSNIKNQREGEREKNKRKEKEKEEKRDSSRGCILFGYQKKGEREWRRERRRVRREIEILLMNMKELKIVEEGDERGEKGKGEKGKGTGEKGKDREEEGVEGINSEDLLKGNRGKEKREGESGERERGDRRIDEKKEEEKDDREEDEEEDEDGEENGYDIFASQTFIFDLSSTGPFHPSLLSSSLPSSSSLVPSESSASYLSFNVYSNHHSPLTPLSSLSPLSPLNSSSYTSTPSSSFPIPSPPSFLSLHSYLSSPTSFTFPPPSLPTLPLSLLPHFPQLLFPPPSSSHSTLLSLLSLDPLSPLPPSPPLTSLSSFSSPFPPSPPTFTVNSSSSSSSSSSIIFPSSSSSSSTSSSSTPSSYCSSFYLGERVREREREGEGNEERKEEREEEGEGESVWREVGDEIEEGEEQKEEGGGNHEENEEKEEEEDEEEEEEDEMGGGGGCWREVEGEGEGEGEGEDEIEESIEEEEEAKEEGGGVLGEGGGSMDEGCTWRTVEGEEGEEEGEGKRELGTERGNKRNKTKIILPLLLLVSFFFLFLLAYFHVFLPPSSQPTPYSLTSIF